MKSKTAVRMLIEEINEELKSAVLVPYRNALHNMKAIALKYEPVNEQQIKDAVKWRANPDLSEQYFNETFEKP